MKANNDTPIADLNVYLGRMQKSVFDKLFFLDKVFEPFDNIVDFGCANGELIKAISLFFGDDYNYYGYDISEPMIEAARSNAPFASFCTDWSELDIPFEKSLINISSTIHEIYSYCAAAQIEEFWDRVFKSGFKYIAIRDMMISESCFAPADEKDLALIRSSKEHAAHLNDYEGVWGRIESRRDLVHFLLKYKYTENWEREVRENYLGLTLEAFEKLIPDDYEITYFDHFTLPFIAWQIKNDFSLDLEYPTHIKIILKNKKTS